VPGSNPIYGLNTLGGALAFTTKSGLTTQGNELGISFGSFGRTKIDLTHGSKSGDGWHRFIAGSAFSEQGWRDESAGSLQNLFVKVGRTQNDSNWDMSFLSGSSKLMGNGLTPSTNYAGLDEPTASGVDGLYERNRKAVYSYPDETKNTTNLLTFNVQRVLDANTELSATAYVRRSTQNRIGGDVECQDGATPEDGCDNFDGANADEIEGEIRRSETSQTSYGISANITKILDAHQLTAGAALDKSKSSYSSTEQGCTLDAATRNVSTTDCSAAADNTAAVTGNTTSVGIYLADTLTLSPATHVTFAGRYNRSTVSNTLTDFYDTDVNDDWGTGVVAAKETFTYKKFNPSVGLTHKLNDSMTFFGNVGQSNRVPTVIELGCADSANPCQLPTGLQADPFLEQVVSRTIEVGMRWKNERNYALAVSAYNTNNKNDILFTPVSAGLGYFDNFSKTRYQGVDLNASKSWGAWSLRTQYSYLYATYQDTMSLMSGDRTMSITPGTRMAGLPMNTLKLHLDWRVNDKLSLGASTISTSKLITQGNEDGLIGIDDESVSADASTKGYTLLNLSASYKAEKGLEFFGKINNALNKRYETYGLIAANNFALDGSTLNGTAGEQTISKFVAPGATRSLLVGMRYKF
jgi:outer membrane receptor protein involved in Fe transport